jgi:hypothetical protein
MKLFLLSFYVILLSACGGGGGGTTTPLPTNVSISLNKSFTSLPNTISTSEGSPYGDTDFWLNSTYSSSNFGYGPAKIQRVYVCLTAEVQMNNCGNYSNNNQPLSQTMLNDLDKHLSQFDNSGIRMVVRFMYNFGPIGPTAQDASITTILTHLDQVAPILLKHKDMVFALEAGFIGTWGEWHDSTNNNDNIANRKLLLDKELSYFKGQFPILVRYPTYLIDYLGSTTASTDFGLHDDYYLSDATDGGTWNSWNSPNTYSVIALKQFAVNVSSTSMFVGELGELYTSLQTCQNIDQYSKTYNVQSMSLNIYPTTVSSFINSEGCLLSFLNKVGTRIELNQATISGNTSAGSTLNVSLTLSNTGYGRVVRARPVNIVLLNGQTVVSTIQVPLSQLDLRQLTNSSPSKTYTFTVTLPNDVTPYAYNKNLNVAISIPDPAPSLNAQSNYMLPLNSLDNNNQIFDTSSGFNKIGTF